MNDLHNGTEVELKRALQYQVVCRSNHEQIASACGDVTYTSLYLGHLVFTSRPLVSHVPLYQSPVLTTCDQSSIFDDTDREDAAVVGSNHSVADFVAACTDQT